MRSYAPLLLSTVIAGCGGAAPGTPYHPSSNTQPADMGTAPVVTDGGAVADLLPPPPAADMARPPNPAGPWPVADLTVYGAAEGLNGPIVSASPDDAQDLWAASADALYLLRPGETRFHRYTAADGLHIQPFTDPDNHPSVTSITAIAGGAAGQVFVGYYGYESNTPFMDTEAQKELGNADKITLRPDGSLAITRYLFRCDAEHSDCWEDRSVRRMLYAHDGVAAGHLFVGFNHGVAHVFHDLFGDHDHVELNAGTPDQRQGEQYGLALTPKGDLWTASRYGVGLKPWDPNPKTWVGDHFIYAFTIYTADHGLFQPPTYREDERGAAVSPEGVVWFASYDHGLASWDPKSNNYDTVQNWSAPGLPTSELTDLAADPDGTLWMTTFGGQLIRFDPASRTATAWPGIAGAQAVYIDDTVVPRAVYVSMSSGLAVIRAK